MHRILKNLILGSFGQFLKIDARNDSPLAWIIGCGLVSAASILLMPQSGLMLLASIAFCVFVQGRSRSKDSYSLAVVAGATAPLGLMALSRLDSPGTLSIFTLLQCGLIALSFGNQWSQMIARTIEPHLEKGSVRNLRPSLSSVTFVEMGPVIAHMQGVAIPDWFMDSTGRKHVFVRCHTGTGSIDLTLLKPGESIVAPGLIYCLESEVSTVPGADKVCRAGAVHE